MFGRKPEELKSEVEKVPVSKAEFENAVYILGRAARCGQLRAGQRPCFEVIALQNEYYHLEDSRRFPNYPLVGARLDEVTFVTTEELRSEQKQEILKSADELRNKIVELTAKLNQASKRLEDLE